MKVHHNIVLSRGGIYFWTWQKFVGSKSPPDFNVYRLRVKWKNCTPQYYRGRKYSRVELFARYYTPFQSYLHCIWGG